MEDRVDSAACGGEGPRRERVVGGRAQKPIAALDGALKRLHVGGVVHRKNRLVPVWMLTRPVYFTGRVEALDDAPQTLGALRKASGNMVLEAPWVAKDSQVH